MLLLVPRAPARHVRALVVVLVLVLVLVLVVVVVLLLLVVFVPRLRRSPALFFRRPALPLPPGGAAPWRSLRARRDGLARAPAGCTRGRGARSPAPLRDGGAGAGVVQRGGPDLAGAPPGAGRRWPPRRLAVVAAAALAGLLVAAAGRGSAAAPWAAAGAHGGVARGEAEPSAMPWGRRPPQSKQGHRWQAPPVVVPPAAAAGTPQDARGPSRVGVGPPTDLLALREDIGAGGVSALSASGDPHRASAPPNQPGEGPVV
ncbi:unnamed protein product [Prorocentrum cordatum]|uniref:Uncharacterized protein n=1 Tax=Prorocentrum cordatum TaxID=2364126 RepID=A0ABN9WEC6_9DINO|nr:unnamed protein product [Polarella glacialis]